MLKSIDRLKQDILLLILTLCLVFFALSFIRFEKLQASSEDWNGLAEGPRRTQRRGTTEYVV